MWNIIIGLIFIIGGASGQLALRGFNSPGGLMAVGGCLLLYGVFQLVQARKE